MAENRYPVVSEQNVFLRCVDRQTLRRDSLPHRTVWGMVYSPATSRWLVQWRRLDKDTCPGLWDLSCAGHVDCVDGQPETYDAAYAREMSEELALGARLVPSSDLRTAGPRDDPQRVPTVDLGYSREYHVCTRAGGEPALEREHVHKFISFYDGPVSLASDGEPHGVAWLSASEIRELLIAPDKVTPAFAATLTELERQVSVLLS